MLEKEKIILKNYLLSHHTIAIIGLAKNAGKTTVLNQIIEEYIGHRIAITSIGFDGEKVDNITLKPKPRIMVYPNTLIATSVDCLKECYFDYEIIEKTDIRTPLGNVVIIEVKTAGLALVAGPSTNTDMKTIITLLYSYGACKVFIDGALFRKSIASYSVADGVILSTGASYNKDINKVVNDTSLLLKHLSLTEVKDEVKEIIEKHLSYPVLIIDCDYFVTFIKVESVVGNEEKIVDSIIGKTRCIYLNGAITPLFVDYLVKKRHVIEKLTIIINDATKVLLDPSDIDNLNNLNITLKVINKITVLALTYNPYSPTGYEFNDEEFKEKLTSITNLPVINILKDKEWLLWVNSG